MPSDLSEPLLDLIYDAAADTARWPQALAAIADACGSEGSIVFGQSIRGSVVFFDYNGRLDESCNAAFKARHVQNEWSLYMEARPAGEIVVSDQVLPLQRLRRTAFYDEVLHGQRVVRNAMVALAKSGDFCAAFNLCRTPRQGPFDAHDLARLRDILPHLQRALRLTYRVEGYRALHQAQEEVLERLSCGVMLLDRKAQLLYANGRARSLLESSRGLRVRGGALGCAVPSDQRRLDALLHAVLQGQPSAVMSLAGPHGAPQVVILSSIRGQDVERLPSLGLAAAPAVMVFMPDPRAAGGLSAARLRAAYGLSAAEARVALASVDGDTVAEMAARLSLSANTVKTHLSNVFAKMGVSRRDQLARLLEAASQVR